MTAIYLYDDARARRFEPFALTRPVSTLVAGVAPIAERWVTALQLPAAAFVAAPHLADFDEPAALALAAADDTIPAGAVLANARFAPALRVRPFPLGVSRPDPVGRAEDAPPLADVWTAGGRVAAVRLTAPLELAALGDGKLALEDVAAAGERVQLLEGWWMDEVWDLVRHLDAMLADDIPYLHRAPLGPVAASSGAPPAHAIVLGDHAVMVAHDVVVSGTRIQRGATIEPQVVFDASKGPIYVGAGSHVHAFSRITGPCYVGREVMLLGGDVTGCSIGDVSKVRGEVSSSIFAGWTNKGHDGFVGHSYLGRWVNLGAGTVTSNLKNTYGSVALWTPEGVRDTGLQFLGTLFGDHAKTGIGLRLTTGTVLGAGANVYDRMPPKAVAPFSWGGGAPYATYRLDKFVEVAERVMARRHVTLSARARRQLAAAHAARWVPAEGGR